MASVKTCLLFISTLALSVATPVKPRQSNGYSIRASSALSTFNGRSVNATGNAFWIGYDTAADCVLAPPNCDGFANTTTVLVGGGGASMYDIVPGGQNVYVKSNGALSFTTPHTEGNFPPGSYTTGFTIGSGNHLLFSGGNSNGWYVCGDGTEPVEVLARVSSAGAICASAQEVQLLLDPVTAPGAYQYE